MKYGICLLTTVPIYRQSGKRSELVSELLFGEVYQLILIEDDWCYIESVLDNFEGWIDRKQVHEIDKKTFDQSLSNYSIALSPLEAVSHDDEKRFVSMGSSLPGFDGLSFKIANMRYSYSGEIIPELSSSSLHSLVQNIAKKMLYVPERKGGRSILGMDGDGFIQFVFKMLGYLLPRKAQHQAKKGKMVHFIHQAQVGDVAFFANPKNKRIFHAGIIINEQHIIHVDGHVRKDLIDHQGIFNKDLDQYTFHLKMIKRYFK